MDNIAKFCKMTVFERRGDRVLVMLSSGNLAGTQAVIGVLNRRCADAGIPNLWNAGSMFEVAEVVADAMRDIERRDGAYLQENEVTFNASFIVGGQVAGEPPRLFRIYAEGNFIEAGLDTPYLQTGETKYGKPIIDRVVSRATPLADATKCVLVSFDSTMRSNLSVGMPIDEGDAYFNELSRDWSEGTRKVFRSLRELEW
jgi:putative proteasome-type protease